MRAEPQRPFGPEWGTTSAADARRREREFRSAEAAWQSDQPDAADLAGL